MLSQAAAKAERGNAGVEDVKSKTECRTHDAFLHTQLPGSRDWRRP